MSQEPSSSKKPALKVVDIFGARSKPPGVAYRITPDRGVAEKHKALFTLRVPKNER